MKLSIEFHIVLLALIIAAAVITAGYLAYDSMSRIVGSVHREAQPDNRLYLIKDIKNDLSAMENIVRLYILTDNDEDLAGLDTLVQQLSFKLDLITSIPAEDKGDLMVIDSISRLAMEKHKVWQEILALHQSAKKTAPAFRKIYSKLEQQKADTITIETEKRGFLRKIFGSKKTTSDTIITTHQPGSEEIREEIRILESEIRSEGQNIKSLESQLIEKNILLTSKLNDLVDQAEQKKAGELVQKSLEVDRLANLTYRQLAAYTATAVLLLLTALFVLFKYLKKSRTYQKALREARQRAEMYARAREQFTANVSHELRTPVNAIYGLTEQALQRNLDPETKEMVVVISKSSQHLKNIINDTLDFSKIEAGGIVLETVDFSPAEICQEVQSIQKYEAIKKGITLSLIPEGKIPDALIGDPLRLKQILINLTGNAIKFTDEGSVKIYLQAEELPESEFRLILEVTDTGTGIPKQELQHIFDEFVQVKHPSGTKQRGTGLGLSITKKLVELHNGKITVESEPGKGTRFRVEMPYHKGDPQNIRHSGQEFLQVPEFLRNVSILVVDDDEYNTFLLRNILKKWGVHFTEKRNGMEAVDAVQHQQFDFILMDVHMPVMNGPEAARIIKDKSPDTRIIAVTATHDINDQIECKKAGMSQFLIKPFSEKELMDCLIQDMPSEITQKTLSKTPVSIKELEYLSNGDKSFMKEMIGLFISTTSSAMEEIDRAIRNDDFENVFENAHKIAASCKQISAERLYSLVKKLEEKSKTEKNTGQVTDLFDSVKKEMLKVHGFLIKYLEEI